MRRTLLIGGVIILILIVGMVGYWFVFRNQTGSSSTNTPNNTQFPDNTGSNSTNNSLPTDLSSGVNSDNGSVLKLKKNEPILAYFVNTKGEITIIEPDGKILALNNQGSPTTLSVTVIPDMQSASFSADGQKVLAAFGTETTLYSVFEFTKKTWRPLTTGIQSPVWSPSGSKLAYLLPGRTNTSILTLDLAVSSAKPQELLRITAENIELAWPDVSRLLLTTPASAKVASSLWNFDLKTRRLTALIEDYAGLETLWSSFSNRGIIFHSLANERGGELVLFTPSPAASRNFSLLTLPDKCIFGTELPPAPTSSISSTSSKTTAPKKVVPEEYIYCAVPRDREALTNAILPDEYIMHALFTEDNFYKIKVADGNLSPIFVSGQPIDALNLKLINNELFFINRFDSKLYSVTLPH